MTALDLDELAARAWVYGFPLVFNLDQVARYVTTGIGAKPGHDVQRVQSRRSSGDGGGYVRVDQQRNVALDGPIDLGGGPVLLQVPATGGGYYALQFVGRLDEQLRLHWPARDRHRGQQLPADSTRLVGTGPRRCGPAAVSYSDRNDHRTMGVQRRRRPRPHPAPSAGHDADPRRSRRTRANRSVGPSSGHRARADFLGEATGLNGRLSARRPRLAAAAGV